MRSRWSTTVTFVPSAPNIEAYSTPITPAPTIVIVRGTRRSSFSSPSESTIVRSSNATVSGRAGCVPTAITIRSARIGSSEPSILTVWSSSKHGVARQPADHVAAELLAHDRGLRGDHVRRAVHQLLERLLLGLLHPRRVEDVERPLGELVEHRLAQRLGRDRPRVDGDAAEPVAALRDGHALAELGGLDGGLLARGSGADDEQIEFHASHPARIAG